MKQINYSEFEISERQAEIILKMVKDGYVTKDKTITATNIESTFKYHRKALMPQIENLVGYGILGKVEGNRKTGYYVTEIGRFLAILKLYDSDIGKTKDADLLEYFPMIKKFVAKSDNGKIRYALRMLGESLIHELKFFVLQGFYTKHFSLQFVTQHIRFNVVNISGFREEIIPQIQELGTAFFFFRVLADNKNIKLDSDVKACLDSVLEKIESDVMYLRDLTGIKKKKAAPAKVGHYPHLGGHNV